MTCLLLQSGLQNLSPHNNRYRYMWAYPIVFQVLEAEFLHVSIDTRYLRVSIANMVGNMATHRQTWCWRVYRILHLDWQVTGRDHLTKADSNIWDLKAHLCDMLSPIKSHVLQQGHFFQFSATPYGSLEAISFQTTILGMMISVTCEPDRIKSWEMGFWTRWLGIDVDHSLTGILDYRERADSSLMQLFFFWLGP